SRLQPHEWVLADDGSLIKVDAAAHGDDHFIPGPTDIAWDLAGITVEWNLDVSMRDHLLNQYRLHSGDDPRERIADYTIAYVLFRLAYTRMAAGAMRGTQEAIRLMRAHQRYRRLFFRVIRTSRR